eukprot:scaffold108591_cov40-Prasinocladus_malaysianus.AAC.1
MCTLVFAVPGAPRATWRHGPASPVACVQTRPRPRRPSRGLVSPCVKPGRRARHPWLNRAALHSTCASTWLGLSLGAPTVEQPETLRLRLPRFVAVDRLEVPTGRGRRIAELQGCLHRQTNQCPFQPPSRSLAHGQTVAARIVCCLVAPAVACQRMGQFRLRWMLRQTAWAAPKAHAPSRTASRWECWSHEIALFQQAPCRCLPLTEACSFLDPYYGTGWAPLHHCHPGRWLGAGSAAW